MRNLLAVVAVFILGVYVLVPFLRRLDPDLFPVGNTPPQPSIIYNDLAKDLPTPDPTIQVVQEETRRCLAKDKNGKSSLDTEKLSPRLPRITKPQIIEAFITGYDPYDSKCVGANAGILPRKTPYGVNVETHGVAVDPAVIPYGSTIKIKGMPPLVADDTGCAMRLAARDPNIINFYQLDVRVPADYSSWPANLPAARREAHVKAGGITMSLGSHTVKVEIIPPQNAD